MTALVRSIVFTMLLVVLTPSPCSRGDFVDPDKLPYLQVGDPAPAFTCVDDRGREWKSAQHYGKRTIVVCFYLGDFFKNCTDELRVMRDHYAALAARDVEIIAISGDSVETHQLFKKTHRLNFALLADFKGVVGRTFGVAMSGGGQQRIKHPETGEEIILRRGVTAARWTFVIDTDGKILHKDTNVKIKEQPRQILNLLARSKK